MKLHCFTQPQPRLLKTHCAGHADPWVKKSSVCQMNTFHTIIYHTVKPNFFSKRVNIQADIVCMLDDVHSTRWKKDLDRTQTVLESQHPFDSVSSSSGWLVAQHSYFIYHDIVLLSPYCLFII